MDNDIFKVRSCLKCISSALNIYSSNFNKIFRATWGWVISLAIIQGLTSFISTTSTDSLSQTSSHTIAILLLAFITSVIFIITTRISSGIVTMLNGESIKGVTVKLLKINALAVGLFVAIIGFIVSVAFVAMQYEFINRLPSATLYIMLCALIIVILVVAALLLSPFIYSATRYIFNKKSKFKEVFGMYYHIGIRRLGFLFSLVFAVTLLCAIIFVFLCIPACITTFASNIDNYGVATGDTSGLPSYFAWLNFMSMAIMTFIIQYMMIWVMFTFFYAYGNIEALSHTK